MPVRTIARPKVKTIDEAIVLMTEKMAESDAKIAESRAYFEKKMAESDAKIAESRTYFEKKIAESDAKIAESRTYFEKKMAESDAKIAESRAYFEKKRAESDAKIAESDAKIAKSQAKTDLAIQRLTESQDKTDLAIQRLTESQDKTDLAIQLLTENVNRLTLRVDEVLTGFGTVGNRFGELVEFLVVPGLRRAINATHKHDFKRSVANKSFYCVGRTGHHQKITEADLLLTNGSEVMAVEIKATLKRSYVDSHLERLKKMRKFAKETGLENKQLYGAVVGVYIDDDAYEHALKNGLYIVNILEEEKKLNVKSPTKARVW